MPSWSPYSYAFDNPIAFADPSGMVPIDQLHSGGQNQPWNNSDIPFDIDNVNFASNGGGTEPAKGESPTGAYIDSDGAYTVTSTRLPKGYTSAMERAQALPVCSSCHIESEEVLFWEIKRVERAFALQEPFILGESELQGPPIMGYPPPITIGGGGSVTLFRAVSQAELADLQLAGRLRVGGGSSYSFGKLFATSAKDARLWAKEFQTLDAANDLNTSYQVIKVRVPANVYNQAYHFTADGRAAVSIDAAHLDQIKFIGTLR